MRGYAVHLLFHALAVVCGAAFGVAAVLWWFDRENYNALYLAVGALVMGVAVLLIQALYIATEPSARRRPRQVQRAEPHPLSQPGMQSVDRRNPTRPEMEPVSPQPHPEQFDQETKTPALEALEEHSRRQG
ncbi:hypothetical protein GCM10009854_24430 [Saccharopolyspora halophila]|uniref:Uncharacterized protein n=1 Tax=Saccharopolyspora halophila TaxID=405551 RepID=A0ABN3G9U8_9PSEU